MFIYLFVCWGWCMCLGTSVQFREQTAGVTSVLSHVGPRDPAHVLGLAANASTC